MTDVDNSKAGDAFKNLEENPEQTDAAPDMVESDDALDRYNGEVSTDFGEMEVSDLLS